MSTTNIGGGTINKRIILKSNLSACRCASSCDPVVPFPGGDSAVLYKEM